MRELLYEIENELLPNALVMGVDHDVFWTMNPTSLLPYTKAFSLKRKYADEDSWRNGLYVLMAIATAMDKKAKYPKMPLSHKADLEHDKEALEIRKMKAIKQTVLERMAVINNRFSKKGG